MYKDVLKYWSTIIKIALNILFLQWLANNFVIKFIEIFVYN